MKKILHIMKIEKFTSGFINSVNSNFDKKQHCFFVYGLSQPGIELEYIQYENVIREFFLTDDVMSTLKDEIKKCDKVIYHGMFDDKLINFFYKNKRELKKLYIYFWGGDKYALSDHNLNRQKKYVIKNANGIITILPEEINYFYRVYGIKGKVFSAKYYDYDIAKDFSEFDLNASYKNSNSVNILLGNSATKTNRHIDMLEALLPYKDEDIRIYVPLSYGIESYTKNVINIGKTLFGDKFIPITEFMEKDKYYNFLKKMDVAIFAMKRQQALGNITALLSYGCKVFLRDNTVMMHYYVTTCNCYVGKIDEIGQINYCDFIELDYSMKLKNHDNIINMMDINKFVSAWGKVFEY